MRTGTENLQQTQSASGANVQQPTKQATIIEPSAEAINHRDTTVEAWRHKSRKSISRDVPFSDHPETYLVVIRGEEYNKKVRIESIIDAYHPFMAIGQAVAEFFAKPAISSIESISLHQRVIKTIKTKE